LKIERILYGMQTGDGKIRQYESPGVRKLVSQKSINNITRLKPEDSGKYLWFRTEQTVAYPVIIEVVDKNPNHGGRTWVQNQTFLFNIHELFQHIFLNDNTNMLAPYILPALAEFPESFETIYI
jgi:hypothetical protein